jgi:hypothetical protein
VALHATPVLGKLLLERMCRLLEYDQVRRLAAEAMAKMGLAAALPLTLPAFDAALRDQFTFIDKKGGVFNLHGHVKFFQGESFANLNARAFSPFDAASKVSANTVLTVLVWSLVSFVVTMCGALTFFFLRLKPDIIAKTIREKGTKAD